MVADEPRAIRRLLFPAVPRGFFLRRQVRTLLRTLHILSTGVLLGGHVFDQPREALLPWLFASAASGALLFATDLHASFAVLFELRGLLVVAKLLLVALALPFWEARVPLLVGALGLGGIGSHMEGALRHRLILAAGRVAVDRRNG